MNLKLQPNIYKRHFLVWLLFVIYIYYSNAAVGNEFAKRVYLFCFTLNFILGYYFLLHKVFVLFDKKKVLAIMGLIASAIFFILYDYLHLKYILPHFGGSVERAKLYNVEFIQRSMLLYTFVFASSFGSYLNYISLKRYKLVLQKENTLLTTELNFFKNQFNSHLTFNFLNFCYSKFLKISPKYSNSVESFSEMLRYTLSNNADIKKSLNEEVEYIRNFIHIQKCLSDNVNFRFNYFSDNENYTIIPMILCTFIENAFKHGVLNEPHNPIDIELNAENQILNFKISNKINSSKQFLKSGIGTDNVDKTLNVFYLHKYKLTITNFNLNYIVKLELEL